MKLRALVLLALLPAATFQLIAQTCSNTATTKTLICAVPQLFNPGGLLLPNTKHKAHFQSASLDTFQPLNTAIGEELSTLPLGSAGSGVSFTFDKEHVPIPTEDSLGPILTERAGVIGKGKVDLGVVYQHFGFGQIDGLNLHRFRAVLTHDPAGPGDAPSPFRNDYITTSNSLNLSLNQTVIYAVFGVSNRLDASVEVPIAAVHLKVNSNAHIVRTVPCESTGTCTGAGVECGEFHYFVEGANCSDVVSSVDATFTNGGDSTGLGDVILRAKYQVIKGEKIGASIGMGFRLPTGDEKNFLGSGAVGIAPFGALTFRARLSPHVRLGYQWNGKSVLVGNPTTATGSKASLPPEVLYSAGVDYRVAKRFTVAADLIGERVLSASRLSSGNITTFTGSVPSIQSFSGDYSADSIGLGGKVRLKRELLLIGNVTMRIDNGGLRAAVVPLVGLSYSF